METENGVEKVDLRIQLEAEEKQKDLDCQKEIQAVLNKYGRTLQGTVSFMQGKNPVWGITIVRNG